ncbi:hypothetical protein [Novosphingobium sp. TH158]|uniref:hypothetical protein n=1 Tax=Novosphingobium sp. TH158 TaxID=2067455 RepID=UPI000C7DAF99|nr:hypothetical protein [Novosphingobium sp. TH158]PLK27091.1 hypothetical protein C0V78_09500 [Novosphingobium sp. TH158]
MLRKLFALALAAVLAGMPPAGGTAAAQSPSLAVDTDQLLLYALNLDQATLSESLAAYGNAEDPLIPLGELSRLLEINFTVQPQARIASGRLGENQRAITVDLAAGRALIGGQVIALVPPDSKVTATDIYLRASLVAKLFPVAIKVSSDEMAIDLTAREKLPIQSRRERVARLSGLMDAPQAGVDALRVSNPYQWVSRPSVDVGLELGADSGTGRAITRMEARVSGDLAKTGFSGWFATDMQGKPSSARVTATRRSASGDLLGPLEATMASAGDVYSPALVLGPRSAGGAGLVITSAGTEESSVFQRINIRGELPIGYDAELYVNDILRSGFAGARNQGRYEFTGVPLVRGRNVVRLVLYGPRGERLEQTRIVNVGGGQLPSGKTQFDAGVVLQDRPVISLSEDNQLASNKARGSVRGVVSVAHGLTAGLTVGGGFASYEDFGGNRHNVINAGVRTSLAGMAVQADFAKQVKGGSALSLGAAGRLAGIGFLARHVEYSGKFNDEANSAWDLSRPMRRYDEVTLDFALPLPGKARLPVSARVERAQFTDGGTSLMARARTTASVAGTLVAMGMDYNRRTGPFGKIENLTGSVSASRFIDYKWQLRASADYRLKPGVRLENVAITADRAINDRYSLRLGASRNFSARDNALQAGFTAHLPFADATLGGDYSTGQKRWRVGLQLNFGLAYDPFRGRYRATPPGPGNGGSAALLAFLDANANGRMDRGEDPVPGVELQGSGRKVITDAAGRAFVTGLGDGGVANLRTDIANTDTVFVAPPPQNVAFEPRAGNVVKVLYPLVPTSELVIRMNMRQQDGTMTGLSAVLVRLVPQKGEVLSAITEFDGSLVFDTVKPGSYTVELDPDQARRLGMRLASPLRVTIGDDGKARSLTGEILFSRTLQ